MTRTTALSAMAIACMLGLGAPRAQDEPGITRADRIAILKTAGAIQRGDQWVICADDPNTSGARIDEVRDLNGDGRPEAVVSEDGTFCHGFVGTGYQILSQQQDGSWKRVDSNNGMPEFLDTTGEGGWPDISVGGPGFCFPVMRWDGSAYVPNRHEYEGKACEPE